MSNLADVVLQLLLSFEAKCGRAFLKLYRSGQQDFPINVQSFSLITMRPIAFSLYWRFVFLFFIFNY